MEKELFNKELKNKAKEIGISLSYEQLDQFYTYMKLLLEWNEKINLTAITEPNEIILKHFVDSLTIQKYMQSESKVLDIGTGAGFPGIPLKILYPEKEFTLLDSLNKRIVFLNTVIQDLNLRNIEAIHSRAEEFIKENDIRESYEIIVSRAVAKLNVLLEYMLPFTKIGGKCICMKSFDIEDELEEAKKAIDILGGEIEDIDVITLPESEIKRKIIIVKKVKNTPKQYPRKAGMPAKEPIR